MRYIILLLITLTTTYAGETKPTPDQVEITKSEKALNTLKAEYLKKANAEVQRLTNVLQDQMKRMTQAGNLEGALALREKIAEISKGDMVTITNVTIDDLLKPKPELPKELSAEFKPFIGVELVTGRVKEPYGVINIDGTCQHATRGIGKWICNKNQIIITWGNIVETLNSPINGKIPCSGTTGNTWTLIKKP